MYCSKCGTENLDNASHCVNCGEPLRESHRERSWEEEIETRAEEFGRRAERFGRRLSERDWEMEDQCFGVRSKTIWPIIFGSFLILLGLANILDETFTWMNFDTLFPIFIIAIGLLIVFNIIGPASKSAQAT
jgi:uncharacterized membrane protein YvbJ